jgi:hypothetical protein
MDPQDQPYQVLNSSKIGELMYFKQHIFHCHKNQTTRVKKNTETKPKKRNE